MITKAFKAYCQMLILASTQDPRSVGIVVKDSSGVDRMICGPKSNASSCFPYSVVTNLGTNASSPVGICIGSGSTTPAENDYALESMITTISGSASIIANAVTDGSNPCLTYTITISNTGSDSITVREIGYFQRCSYIYYGSANSTYFLLDRTLLSTPVTIPAGETKTIQYVLVVPIGA